MWWGCYRFFFLWFFRFFFLFLSSVIGFSSVYRRWVSKHLWGFMTGLVVAAVCANFRIIPFHTVYLICIFWKSWRPTKSFLSESLSVSCIQSFEHPVMIHELIPHSKFGDRKTYLIHYVDIASLCLGCLNCYLVVSIPLNVYFDISQAFSCSYVLKFHLLIVWQLVVLAK